MNAAAPRRSTVARLRFAAGMAGFALLQGCATVGGGPNAGQDPRDPWERWNRQVYSFNESLDAAVLKPVATTYQKVLPSFVRRGVDNVFNNFADVWSGVNNLLQGKVEAALRDTMRVTTNTFLGIFGLLDIATEAGIDRQGEDFGQTLGRWGFGPGPYVVWPVIGPSTLRDSAGLPLDLSVTPALAFSDTPSKTGVSVLGAVNTRANLLGATGMLDDISLDKYTFVRDGYLQRRKSKVYDGNPPAEAEERYDLDEAPAAPAAAASAASAPAPASAAPASAAGGK